MERKRAVARSKQKGDVELHGLTKAGKSAKKPFAYITVAQNETLAEMQAAGFSLDDMIVCTKYVDSELYNILKTYKEKGWEKAAVFGYTYAWSITKEEQKKYNKKMWYTIRPPHLTDEDIKNWQDILRDWKAVLLREENSKIFSKT